MSRTLPLYERFTRFPLGNILFSKPLAFRAPYFSTIHPRVTDLRSGYCHVEIKDRWSIRNHLESIHIPEAPQLSLSGRRSKRGF